MLFADKKLKALEMVVNAEYDWLTCNKLTFNCCFFFFVQLAFNFTIYHLIQNRPKNKPKISLTLLKFGVLQIINFSLFLSSCLLPGQLWFK